MSAFQAAKLKENRQINTLIELTYQIKEDEETDAHLRKLDDSAYAARRQVEDTRLRAEDLERNTLFEREALTSKLSRLRKLRRAEQNLQDAKLISYFLSQEPVEHSASLDLVKNIKEPEAHLNNNIASNFNLPTLDARATPFTLSHEHLLESSHVNTHCTPQPILSNNDLTSLPTSESPKPNAHVEVPTLSNNYLVSLRTGPSELPKSNTIFESNQLSSFKAE